ncbi:YesL family protein [Neobacillus cucumis]|uniref:YesL family protein n=1 Tax=Neobacillus cucumis TaxID=1740721 RepID=UPI00399CB57D
MRLAGSLYRVCTWIYNFALLNALFLIYCIPIVTIFPALSAMFGIVREWVNKNEPPVFSTFNRLFKENFKQCIFVGVFITVAAVCLLGDFFLLTKLETSLNLLIFSSAAFMSFCFMISILYIFPLMVHCHNTFKELITNSFKFGLYKFHITILNFVILIGWLLFSLRYSFFLVFFFSSVSSFITYWFTSQKLTGLIIKREKETNSISII